MLRNLCVTLCVAALAVGVTACGDSDVAGQDRPTCDLFSNLVVDGGVGRDGIPALTNPNLAAADSADFLQPGDRVLGVVQNGTARAYPIPVLWWHEIINDTLGGEPVLTTYCPLTGSGLAFDPRVGAAGTVAEFGVSGLLFENNLMMFDRETESLWPQLLLGAACGDETGTELRRVAVVETTWDAWRAEYPTTTVVSTNTGFNRNYDTYPYGNYDLPSNPVLLAPSSPYSMARLPKELMLGVQVGGETVAYPYAVLDTLGTVSAVNDTVGGQPIVVTFHAASNTPLAFDARVAGVVLTLAVSGSVPELLEDAQTGSLWTHWGLAVDGPLNGTRLRQLRDAYTVFWFAWSIFHPDTRLFR